MTLLNHFCFGEVSPNLEAAQAELHSSGRTPHLLYLYFRPQKKSSVQQIRERILLFYVKHRKTKHKQKPAELEAGGGWWVEDIDPSSLVHSRQHTGI